MYVNLAYRIWFEVLRNDCDNVRGQTDNKNVTGLFIFLIVTVNCRRYEGKLAYQ